MKRSFQFSFVLMLALTLTGIPGAASASPFTSGDLAVVRVGDGVTVPASGVAAPVFIDEYTPSGTLVESVPLPTKASGTNQPLTLTDGRQLGALQLSTNGQYLTVGGLDTVSGGGNYTTGRTIGRIDNQGNVNTSTTLTDAYNGTGSLSGVTSVDGSNFWLSGTNGVHYETLGGSSSTALNAQSSNQIVINNGQLYFSAGSSSAPTTNGVWSVGTGLPTTSSQTAAILPGFPESLPNTGGFVFFNLHNSPTGADTLYLGVFPQTGYGLQKWTFDGTNWNLVNTFSTGLTGGILQLTGELVNGVPVLFGTTRPAGGGGNLGNSLVTLTDNGNSAAFTTLTTVGADYGLRGVSFVPVAVPEPSTFVLLASGLTLGVVIARRRQGGRRSL